MLKSTTLEYRQMYCIHMIMQYTFPELLLNEFVMNHAWRLFVKIQHNIEEVSVSSSSSSPTAHLQIQTKVYYWFEMLLDYNYQRIENKGNHCKRETPDKNIKGISGFIIVCIEEHLKSTVCLIYLLPKTSSQ